MDSLDLFADALGLDVDNPDDARAIRLAQVHEDFLSSLVKLRKRDFAQNKFAKRMGRDPASVSRFEQIGTDPHLSTILRYAVALGVDYTIQVDDPRADDDDNVYRAHFGVKTTDDAVVDALVARAAR